MKDHATTIVAVIITVVVTWLITQYTNQIEAGADAQILQARMESGQTLGEYLKEREKAEVTASVERAEMKANQRNIIETLNRQIDALNNYARSE